MRSSHSFDRLGTAFDDDRLVADAGLLLPATLAHRLGLRGLVYEHLDLGTAAGRANPGDKLLTLVLSAIAGGDCIDDANPLRAGGTGRVLGFSVKAASTLGTWHAGRRVESGQRDRLRLDADPELNQGDGRGRHHRAARQAPSRPSSPHRPPFK